MAPPRNNDRHSSHTGTIPKTKVRNNYNVPQEAVTPTRRDMSSNLVSTSLDWVPVSEYNTRSNYNQSRKPANNSSDHELTDLDNSVSFESGFGRFVPVRPQPRVLPLNRDHTGSDQNDDGAGSSVSSYSHQTYTHSMQNGLIPHSNHAAAAVMIVNPTTPNAVTGNISQQFNTPSNQNRNNLTRNLNPTRNNFDGNSNTSNNTTPPIPNSRSGTKTVNLMNNMYESGQGSSNNINDNHGHRDSARTLGDAIVAACPDAAAVERRLGQIREYIRVTSSLVDTMRNSEDEAYIEHTKEEYDELVAMVMKLKESETKLEAMLVDNEPENVEVPAAEPDEPVPIVQSPPEPLSPTSDVNMNLVAVNNAVVKATTPEPSQTLKKVTNIENEQLNKTLHSIKVSEEEQSVQETKEINEDVAIESIKSSSVEHMDKIEENNEEVENRVEIKEIESVSLDITEDNQDDLVMNDVLRQNILSCVEKVALIEELKQKYIPSSETDNQEVVVRPMSVQSNGSGYSENELWQNEIKNKMEMSQQRLVSLKQQQKRLLKYQAEAKQQLDEMNRARQSQEIQPSTSHDNLASMQNQLLNGGHHHQNAARMYAANQIGVATTLPHSEELQPRHNMQGSLANIDNDSQTHDDRFSHRAANIASSEEAAGGDRDSDVEEDEGVMNERGRQLTMKLRELQMKKQHMESLVSEFQKLQMAARLDAHNRYSSSGEESLDEEPARKCNKSAGNNKNEDPFKLMEIKAIKTALQKTKDLMRSVETYEAEHLAGIHDETFQLSTHSNIHDNKSEDGGSAGGWSNDGSVRRVRNALPPRHKFTNEQHRQHRPPQQQQSHEANIASLQELAQELRLETEKIMGERARLKDMVSSKEFTRKQKKVNEEVRPGTSGVPGPAERRQMELRALLTQKQKELESLLNKEVLSVNSEGQQLKPDSRAASMVNQSYNSEQDDPDSRSEQILIDPQNARENEDFRGGGDSGLGGRSLNTLPSQLGSAYASDSDTASRSKMSQRARVRRRQPQERQPDESHINPSPMSHASQNMRHEPRMETVNVNAVPPIAQNGENPINMAYPHQPPQSWPSNKSNQDMRANQFTQNSHSQTMERLLGTPQMTYPPSMPFNMMMPYGMVGGCGCGCGLWGAWCWQQLVMQQREIHQLREQLNHLEERWRVETASHTLNNQVPPGNRANNYWDNFRSYSRQNLLSASSKTNADGHLGVGPAHNPHPLVERSHNALHPSATATPPSNTPKRNVNAATSTHNSAQQPANPTEDFNRHARSNVTYERSLSFSSAPDVLNVNQNNETEPTAPTQAPSRNIDENVNINRQDMAASNSFRNLNIANPIPEIIQSHANNLNTPTHSLNSKRKSSSKLPAKNSGNRRNYTLDYSQTSNINIAGTSDTVNHNAAAANREMQDQAASQLFDFLRENVYSEVTALIGVNESHPDFLIQLFRELQLISSDPLRQRVLQSIRNVLSQYPSITESEHNNDVSSYNEQSNDVSVTTTTNEGNHFYENNAAHEQNACASSNQVDNGIVRFLLLKSEDICTPELIDKLVSVILNSPQGRQAQVSKKRLLDILSKYEGMRVCDVSGDILESLPLIISVNNDGDESTHHTSELSESSILQDVAGSLNLFSSSETQLHQMNCPYDMWPGHVHVDMEPPEEGRSARSQEGKLDLINCSEMHNGDLAEADQTCRAEVEGEATRDEATNAEALPDVVDTDETTPTEAEAEWLGLDRVPTRLHMEDSPESQKG